MTTTQINKMLEWGGAIFGVAGNILIALNLAQSKWGFVLFIISNALLIPYAIRSKAKGLLAMYIIYTIITTIGIVRWFIN